MKPNWEHKRLGIRLYRGDCLQVLPRLKLDRVSAILTDPPYGDTCLVYDREPALEWCRLLEGFSGTLATFASFRYARSSYP